MSSNPDSDSNPLSVLVPRASTQTGNTESVKSFRFSVPSLSKSAIQPELPNLFQAEKQANAVFLQHRNDLSAPKMERKQAESLKSKQQLNQIHNAVGRVSAAPPTRKQSVASSDPNCILVSNRQEKNSLLNYIRNVRWKFADDGSLLCDYLVGSSAAVLYLTLRYHMQCPEYIHARMGPLKHAYRLRVLLVLVDMEDLGNVLEDLTRVAFINNWTMMCAFSIPEAAQYIETLKAQERASFDSIKERNESDYASIFSSVLVLIRSVNKTDVVTLSQAFGSLVNIMGASVEELSQCPGIGTLKAARIYEAFHQPFRQERW